MSVLTLDSPAKINLLLAITGRRTDGFHALVSVVAPLAWGDTLRAEIATELSIVCNDPAVPTDSTNLIWTAAEIFRKATGWKQGVRFSLEKRIPMGAGLGGGSSNAVAALKALNALAGDPLDHDRLAGLAADVGSDCPLFLHDGPVIMRGRGDIIAALPARGAGRVSGRRILVFKPAFGIPTPWAYAQLAAKAPSSYVSGEEAEKRLAAWLASEAPVEDLLLNSMEAPAFTKFPALPVLLDRLSREFGLHARMSGSGSACFAVYDDALAMEGCIRVIRESWGESALVLQTRLQ